MVWESTVLDSQQRAVIDLLEGEGSEEVSERLLCISRHKAVLIRLESKCCCLPGQETRFPFAGGFAITEATLASVSPGQVQSSHLSHTAKSHVWEWGTHVARLLSSKVTFPACIHVYLIIGLRFSHTSKS